VARDGRALQPSLSSWRTFLLIIWGYALTRAHVRGVRDGTLVLNYPDMLKATAGSLLLLATGVISPAWRAAR